MNSKIILGIVAVLVLLGVGAYLVAGNKTSKNSASTKMTAQNNTKVMTDESTPKSFKDLLTMGVAQKCTFNNTVDAVTSEGVVYTSGGKMRTDITTTANGKSTVTHMIMSSNISHIWLDSQKQGYMMSLDSKDIEDVQKEGEKMNMNMNQKYDYKCTPSVVSDSMFTLPSGVEFMDLTQMMPQTSVTGGMKSEDVKKMKCAMCGGLSGNDKVECLATLSCN